MTCYGVFNGFTSIVRVWHIVIFYGIEIYTHQNWIAKKKSIPILLLLPAVLTFTVMCSIPPKVRYIVFGKILFLIISSNLSSLRKDYCLECQVSTFVLLFHCKQLSHCSFRLYAGLAKYLKGNIVISSLGFVFLLMSSHRSQLMIISF